MCGTDTPTVRQIGLDRVVHNSFPVTVVTALQDVHTAVDSWLQVCLFRVNKQRHAVCIATTRDNVLRMMYYHSIYALAAQAWVIRSMRSNIDTNSA